VRACLQKSQYSAKETYNQLQCESERDTEMERERDSVCVCVCVRLPGDDERQEYDYQ